MPKNSAVDYEALARKYGATDINSSQSGNNVDYEALAQKHGAVAVESTPQPAEDTGIWASLKRNGSALYHMPGQVYDAFTKPPQDDTEYAASQLPVGGQNLPPQIALALHRLVAAPMIAEHEKAQALREKAKTQMPEEASNAYNGTEHMANMHQLASMFPVLGPIASQITERYLSGDKSGAATDLATMIATPKIAEEATGALARGVRGVAGNAMLKTGTAMTENADAIGQAISSPKEFVRKTVTNTVKGAGKQLIEKSGKAIADKGRAMQQPTVGDLMSEQIEDFREDSTSPQTEQASQSESEPTREQYKPSQPVETPSQTELASGNPEYTRDLHPANKSIGKFLNDEADKAETAGDTWRARALRNGAQTIAEHPEDVSKMTPEQMREISGIGEGISGRIDKLLKGPTTDTPTKISPQSKSAAIREQFPGRKMSDLSDADKAKVAAAAVDLEKTKLTGSSPMEDALQKSVEAANQARAAKGLPPVQPPASLGPVKSPMDFIKEAGLIGRSLVAGEPMSPIMIEHPGLAGQGYQVTMKPGEITSANAAKQALVNKLEQLKGVQPKGSVAVMEPPEPTATPESEIHPLLQKSIDEANARRAAKGLPPVAPRESIVAKPTPPPTPAEAAMAKDVNARGGFGLDEAKAELEDAIRSGDVERIKAARSLIDSRMKFRAEKLKAKGANN